MLKPNQLQKTFALELRVFVVISVEREQKQKYLVLAF